MTQAPLMDRIRITEDYDVPRVINGGWQLSAGHALERPLDLADASRAFNRLIDMGFDTFDCADIYTGVEDFFGGIIRERRKAGLRLPQIHTKFVPDLNDLANVTPAYVENIITRSLRRLGVERLDAVQFHWWDYSVPGMVDVASSCAFRRRASSASSPPRTSTPSSFESSSTQAFPSPPTSASTRSSTAAPPCGSSASAARRE